MSLCCLVVELPPSWPAEENRAAAKADQELARRSAAWSAIERRPRPPSATRPKRNCSSWPARRPPRPIASSSCCRRTTTRCRWPCATGSSRIRQQVEDRVAKAAVESTTVTLSAEGDAAGRSVRRDRKANRQQADRQSRAARASEAPRQASITIELKDEPFWPAIDQILDQANLGIYSYGGEDALSIVLARSDDGPRHGAGDYTAVRSASKCWKFKASAICGSRNSKSLKLQLEVAWEPRLRPIALSQPVADVDGHDRRRTASLPSASRKRCSTSKCRAARRRPKSSLPFELPPRREENHHAQRQTAGAGARPAGEVPLRRPGQSRRQKPSAAAACR